ncbi:MAG: hypothetical protein K6E47_04125 [Lachnospiraceae bacterium]|nr:hypothetical protein [Lachnospiraceae bacterium]
MFEWKFKYSRAFIFGICFLILFAYTIVAFIPEAMIVNSFEDEPVRIRSVSELKENYHNLVEIEYEYGFSALYARGNYFTPDRDHGVLKLAGSKDMVICSTPPFIDNTLKDGFYVANNINKIVPKSDGNTYVIRGYVDKTEEYDQKMLKKQIQDIYDSREMPDPNESINYEFVVQILNPDKEKESYKKQIFYLACITGVFLLSLIMLIKEIYRYKHYGLEEEERERREQNGRDEDQV